MIKVGITGQSGFIGTHLFNTLGLSPDKFERILFEDSFFLNDLKLHSFVSNCDAIVHLAALNRHNNPQEIYETNLQLVKKLIRACDYTGSKPHILFSSSSQEERDNLYGKSKKEGRELLNEWAIRNDGRFTGLIIPNVFGPFGNPYYNSVVATFCYQLTHNEKPHIDVDSDIKLIYVGELVSEIIRIIELKTQYTVPHIRVENKIVPHLFTISVTDLLNKLTVIKEDYLNYGGLPDLNDTFTLNLFNTFLTYIDHRSFFPYHLKINKDKRGSFVETVKLKSGGQVSFSTTVSGITRGNHFHTRKAERFVIIKGSARIEIRRIGTPNKISFDLRGDSPSFVDMPVWHTHNITNTGREDLYTIFWISESFNPSNPDTYFEQV